MASVVDELAAAVGVDCPSGRNKSPVNGWAILAVTRGVVTLTTELVARLESFSFVCSILLINSLHLVRAPTAPSLIEFLPGVGWTWSVNL
jgi:hypothetical protein